MTFLPLGRDFVSRDWPQNDETPVDFPLVDHDQVLARLYAEGGRLMNTSRRTSQPKTSSWPSLLLAKLLPVSVF